MNSTNIDISAFISASEQGAAAGCDDESELVLVLELFDPEAEDMSIPRSARLIPPDCAKAAKSIFVVLEFELEFCVFLEEESPDDDELGKELLDLDDLEVGGGDGPNIRPLVIVTLAPPDDFIFIAILLPETVAAFKQRAANSGGNGKGGREDAVADEEDEDPADAEEELPKLVLMLSL